jgi:hypothetical protein
MMEFEQTESHDTAEPSTIEESGHDWEPSDAKSPMHTNSLCRICGQPKSAVVHK